ncbi:hypothetical protein OC842_002702 [Tilletia horrida]|uniref:BZIP domain-containing protein n=1 Tax=Tilletia horrida TaxID=155126 RepID=A0AAN6GFF6_9BASI|nr:hypothetical protein OC842_002702 [Tilletia horrida]
MATAVQQPNHLPAAQQQQQQEDQHHHHHDCSAAAAAAATTAATTAIDEFLDLPSPAPAHTRPVAAASQPASAQPSAAARPGLTKMTSTAKASTPAATAAAATGHSDIQSLAVNAPIAAASLANGPPPPGSSPEVLFRYYLASELRRMGSPFDDSVIDKYVKQHTKTLDAARKAGSTSPAARPSPAAGAEGPSADGSVTSAPVSSDAVSVSAASLLSGLAPPLAINIAPSPFKLTASGMAAHTTSASIDTAAIFSPAAVGVSLPQASINPHLVQLAPPGVGTTATSKPSATSAAPAAFSIKAEPRTPQVAMSDLMEESDGDEGMKEEDDDEDLDDDDDEHDEDTSTSRARSTSATTSPSTSMQSNSKSFFSSKKAAAAAAAATLGHFNSSASSPGSAPGVPASLAAISEDLRPSAEEYRKLSSKEKRQLRNKISARNFRTRRKEYIGQLEDQIADRDQIIEGLRQQVAQLTATNRELDEEVKTLRERTLSQTDVTRIFDALQKSLITAPIGSANTGAGAGPTLTLPTAAAALSEMGPPAAPGAATATPTVTLPTLAGAGPALARTPMRSSTSSTSLSDFFGSITNRPGTPMQTSRPSTPLSPLFPALSASATSAGMSSGSGAGAGAGMLGFSPSLRPSLARRPSPASFNLGSAVSSASHASSSTASSIGGSSTSLPTLGHAGPITQPNTKKDVAPNGSADSFWAGSSSSLAGAPGSSPFGAGAGGFMQVHMTLVDELLFPPTGRLTRPALPPSSPTSSGASKFVERCAEQLQHAAQSQRSQSPPAYAPSSFSLPAFSDVKKGAGSKSAMAPVVRRPSVSSTQHQVQSSATARVEVEDAFMRLLLGEEAEDEDTPPSYLEATSAGAASPGSANGLLLAGPVPTFCKV